MLLGSFDVFAAGLSWLALKQVGAGRVGLLLAIDVQRPKVWTDSPPCSYERSHKGLSKSTKRK